jgi:hypothetical protein
LSDEGIGFVSRDEATTVDDHEGRRPKLAAAGQIDISALAAVRPQIGDIGDRFTAWLILG